MSTRMVGFLGVAAMIALAVSIVGNFWSLETAFVKGSYFIIVACSVFAADVMRRLIPASRLVRLIRAHWPALVGAVILTVVVSYAVEPGYRVLSDETNLLAVAKSLYYDKTAYNSTMGKWFYEDYHSLSDRVPKRPLLYQFLVAAAHTVRGYDYRNGFYVNLVCLAALLTLIYALVRRSASTATAVAAQLLTVSVPIIALIATGAGFDLLSLLLQIALFAAILAYVARPGALMLATVWALLVLFANVRYENLVVGVIAASALLAERQHLLAHARANWHRLVWTPLLLFPLLAQLWLTGEDRENPKGVAVFSLEHLLNHTADIPKTLFDTRFYFPYPGLLALLSLIAAGYAVYRLVRGGRREFTVDRRAICVGVVLAVAFLFQNVVFLAYYLGSPAAPYTARLFSGLALAIVLLPIWVAVRFGLPSSRLLLALGVVGSLMYLPVAGAGRHAVSSILLRETRLAYEYVLANTNQRALIIAERPGQYTVLNRGAVSFQFARQNPRSVFADLERRTVDRVIVLQKISYATGRSLPETELPAAFNLATLAEHQVTGNFRLRIAELILPKEGAEPSAEENEIIKLGP